MYIFVLVWYIFEWLFVVHLQVVHSQFLTACGFHELKQVIKLNVLEPLAALPALRDEVGFPRFPPRTPSHFDKPQLRLISNRLLITSSSWLWLNKSYAYAMKSIVPSIDGMNDWTVDWLIPFIWQLKQKYLNRHSTRKVTDKSIIIRWLLLCMSCINFMQSQPPAREYWPRS